MNRRSPTRMCLGCRGRFEKSRLVRIGRAADGLPYLDESGKGDGRGAYMCASESCMERALTRKNLSRALRLGSLEAVMSAGRNGGADHSLRRNDADLLKMERALSALRMEAASRRRLLAALQIEDQRSGSYGD